MDISLAPFRLCLGCRVEHLVDQALENVDADTSDALGSIDRSIDCLVDAAKALADDYFKSFSRISGKNGNPAGSKMASVRDRVGATGKTLEIRWIVSFGTESGRQRRTIAKGKGHSYSIPKLVRRCPDWERELIHDTEIQFARIRSTYSELMAVKQLLIKSKRGLRVE